MHDNSQWYVCIMINTKEEVKCKNNVVYVYMLITSTLKQGRDSAVVILCQLYCMPRKCAASINTHLHGVSVSACYCIPQFVRLIAGDWCLHVVDQ